MAVLKAFAKPFAITYFTLTDLKNTIVRMLAGDVLSDNTLREASGSRFAVVALYQPFRFPKNLLSLLDTLCRAGINIIAVSNLKLSAEQKAQLEPYLHRLIVRRNTGRDFGAYKAGVLKVLTEYQASRLFLFNDSIFTVRPG